MSQNVFHELKRYVRFGHDDEALLRDFAPRAAPHFVRIVDGFYERVLEHVAARKVFSGPEQVARLKRTLRDWLQRMLEGPWDDEYGERRTRIGRVHVQIGLRQHYMFGALDLIRLGLLDVVAQAELEPAARTALPAALHKILDIELALMLESYREAYVEQLERQQQQERGELQRRLALSEARYEEIVEKADVLVTTLDAAGRVVLVNTKCEQLLGRRRAELRGWSWLDLFVPVDDHGLVRSHQQQAAAGRAAPSYEAAVPGLHGHGCRIRWQFTTLPGGSGPLVCAIGVDVSRERELAIQKRRAERLTGLGTMASGLAHEIRNPLNAARLQLNVAERRLARAESDVAREAIYLAQSELERLAALVQDFLEFSRPQPLQLVKTELRGMVQKALARLAEEASTRGVALQLRPGDEVVLELDPERIEKVLLNLLRNALEASHADGRVQVSVTREDHTALLIVQDEGPGMPPDAPIFEPFFTTKEYGTGLGLAIVHRIVLDHGGEVSCHSQPADTQFRVMLPGAQATNGG